MIELTPRKLVLDSYYEDGEEARHYRFSLDSPGEDDQRVMPGQFFMLVLPGFGEAPFTYVSPPDQEGAFTALIRRTGALSNALFALPPGAIVGYRGPFGHGWPQLSSAQRVLAVAGGCGLAPLAGLIEAAASPAAGLDLTVIYGARSVAAQVLGRERARWRQQLPWFETVDQAAAGMRQGSPLAHFDELFARAQPEVVLCCGPQALMQATAEECRRRGVAAERIWLSIERRMHCAVGLCGHCYVGSSYVCTDGPTYRYDRYQTLQSSTNAPLERFDHSPC